MIRIRRLYSSALPADRERVEQVVALFRRSFPDFAGHAEEIPDMLDRPFRRGYRTVLLVADAADGKLTGFSLMVFFSEISTALLDFMAVDPATQGHGLGGVLYEATKELALGFGARALYFEALADDPRLEPRPERLEENRARLRFYERLGARPIEGTAYETPVGGGAAPYLLYDGLGRKEAPGRDECREAVRLILQRKYGHLLSPAYIDTVVASIKDDPVRLRAPQHPRVVPRAVPAPKLPRPFALVLSEVHQIHHVRERGYVERPARVGALAETLRPTGLFDEIPPRAFGEKLIRSVHDGDFVTYLKNVCEKLDPEHPVYPYVFPIRRPERRPRDLAVRAGYYCIDTFTPLDRNAYKAARAAVDVALTAAEQVMAGRHVAYALCRPPGHHAERRVFGGFCYFNNAAVAAERLCREARVAVLDIDFHHGNGTQDIFWQRADVLTLSIHGHPSYAYPYFSGFADEIGEGPGRGANRNFPLPENSAGPAWLEALAKALDLVERHRAEVLVVSLGFDTLKGDPTGNFVLRASDLGEAGRRLAETGLPVLVVQEGGYSLRNLRAGASAFFGGMASVLGS